jgi:hypothetical protein
VTSSSYATDYTFVKRMNDDLVGLSSSHGQQLFTRARVRKHRACALCKRKILPGSLAYRPITNGYNRMHRLCVPCVQDLER